MNATIHAIRPNLKAYCCSYTCTGMNDHEVRPKDYKLIENISVHKTFCPTCGYALLWSDDAKNERKRTSNEIQSTKGTFKFTNSGR